jgi:hypothetical protein
MVERIGVRVRRIKNMDLNPYEAPRHVDPFPAPVICRPVEEYPYSPQPPVLPVPSQSVGARDVWRVGCLWSLFATLLFFVRAQLLAIAAPPPRPQLFFVVDGALALGGLSSLTLAGFAAIGCVLSPRKSQYA